MATSPPSPFRRRVPLVLAVFSAVLAVLHVTVWYGLVAEVPAPARAPLTLGMAAGFFALFVTFGARVRQTTIPRSISTLAYTWLGVLFLGFVGTLISSPIRGLAWLAGAPGLQAPLAAATALGVLGVSGFGLMSARAPRIARVSVPIVGLAPELAGFRVVQISDVHVGHTSRAFLESVVDAVNALEPDLIAITGDLVEGTVDEVGPDLVGLARLRATHGVFFVTGNHEYYGDGARWAEHLPSLGLRVLRNERVRVTHAGAALDVVGVDDPFGTMTPGHGADLDAAMAGRDLEVPTLLLAHQPVTVVDAARHGVSLQISGHTHGGQIWPFHWLVLRVQPYLAGLVRHGDTWLYVHRGTGHWGPPLRVGAPSEIALLELAVA